MSGWVMSMLGMPNNDSNNNQSRTRPVLQSSCAGYLWKMKRAPKILSPQWSRRYFTLEGRRLKWYESDAGDVEKGSVDLKSITGVSRFEPGNRGVFSFILCCPDRNLLLRANCLTDMDKWIRAIQTQADRARGGSGMGVITGLFPSMAPGRRGKKALPTLEKELDRIVQRLTFLENEIILNTDDICVREKSPRATGYRHKKEVDSKEDEDDDKEEGKSIGVRVRHVSSVDQIDQVGKRAASIPSSGFVPRRVENPLAEKILVDFDGSELDFSDDDVSSKESAPVTPTVRQGVKNGWTGEGGI